MDRSLHGEELYRRRDVVDTHDRGAVECRPPGGGQTAGETLRRRRTGELAEEALAAGADEQRPADLGERVEVPQQLEVLRPVLGETQPGVEDHLLARHTGSHRALEG